MPLEIENINTAIAAELTQADELRLYDPKNTIQKTGRENTRKRTSAALDRQETRRENTRKRISAALGRYEDMQSTLGEERRAVCPGAPKR